MAGVKKRRRIANYLNVSKTAEEEYVFMGTGYKSLEETPAAQTSSTRYINDASATKSINGYDWSTPFDLDQIRDQQAIEFICEIGETQKTGGECETDYIVVDLDKQAQTANAFYARKFRVAIEVASFTNNDGQMGATGNLLGIGDLVIGTFDTTTKTFTEGFEAAPAAPTKE